VVGAAIFFIAFLPGRDHAGTDSAAAAP